jgi:hypothetical protein
MSYETPTLPGQPAGGSDKATATPFLDCPRLTTVALFPEPRLSSISAGDRCSPRKSGRVARQWPGNTYVANPSEHGSVDIGARGGPWHQALSLRRRHPTSPLPDKVQPRLIPPGRSLKGRDHGHRLHALASARRHQPGAGVIGPARSAWPFHKAIDIIHTGGGNPPQPLDSNGNLPDSQATRPPTHLLTR